MPIYIKENPAYFIQSLDSILRNQTVLPTELVLVEDGPLTDELNQIVAQYQQEFPTQLRVFKLQKNMGVGFAMNYGLGNCNYEWVFRMDTDDIAVNTRFEEQIKLIKTEKYDLIGSSINEFNDVVGDLNQVRLMPEKHADIVKLMKYRCPFNHMTVAFKKSIAIKAKGYWDKRNFEDYNLWYEMYKAGARLYNSQESLVYARIGNNMVSRRSGTAYHKYEKEFISKMYQDKFLNFFEYKSILSVKKILRALPVSVLEKIYKAFLRK